MKSIFGALGTIVGAALAELDKPASAQEPIISVKEVEVYYTLLVDGSSEMWTEEYKKLDKLIEDFKFFSKYKAKSPSLKLSRKTVMKSLLSIKLTDLTNPLLHSWVMKHLLINSNSKSIVNQYPGDRHEII